MQVLWNRLSSSDAGQRTRIVHETRGENENHPVITAEWFSISYLKCRYATYAFWCALAYLLKSLMSLRLAGVDITDEGVPLARWNHSRHDFSFSYLLFFYLFVSFPLWQTHAQIADVDARARTHAKHTRKRVHSTRWSRFLDIFLSTASDTDDHEKDKNKKNIKRKRQRRWQKQRRERDNRALSLVLWVAR